MTEKKVLALNLKVGELMEFEKATGKSIAELEGPQNLGVTESAVLIWIVERRTNPDLALADIEALDMTEFEQKISVLEDLFPPTEAAGSQSK